MHDWLSFKETLQSSEMRVYQMGLKIQVSDQ